VWSSVVGDHALDGFNADFSSAVAVRVCNRRQTMVDTPRVEELSSGDRCEFGSSVRREFVWDAIGDEAAP